MPKRTNSEKKFLADGSRSGVRKTSKRAIAAWNHRIKPKKAAKVKK